MNCSSRQPAVKTGTMPHGMMDEILLLQPSQGKCINNIGTAPSIKGRASHKYESSGKVIVSIERTPTYLTPSQRLQMRKQLMNDRIAQRQFKSANDTREELDLDSDDEEIDYHVDMFNVPISVPIENMIKLKKLPFQYERGLSFTTESTRCSSIFSSASANSLCSSGSNDSCPKLALNDARFNERNLSQDALEISLNLGTDEKYKMIQEARERKKMLNQFLEVNCPNVPLQSPVGDQNCPGNHSSGARSKTNFSRYYLSTRPSWLPPKSSYDKVRHQKESEDRIYHALSKQDKIISKKLKKIETLKKLKSADSQMWRLLDETQIRMLKSTAEGRDMYWRGIPNFKRAYAWSALLEPEKKISNETCSKYFYKSSTFVIRNTKVQSETNIFLKLLETIDSDLLNTFTEKGIFQETLVARDLRETIISFLLYSRDKFASGMNENQIESSKILCNSYCPGITNLTALLYSIYLDKYMVFRTLCIVYSSDNLISKIMRSKQEGLYWKDLNSSPLAKLSIFEKFLQRLTKLCPSLSAHLESKKVLTIEYAPSIIIGMFTSFFNFDLCMHILDIWLFEGDSFLIATLLATLKVMSHKLFGSRSEIMDMLEQHTSQKHIKVGDLDDFINLVHDLMTI